MDIGGKIQSVNHKWQIMKATRSFSQKHCGYNWHDRTIAKYSEDSTWQTGYYTTRHGVVGYIYGEEAPGNENYLSLTFVWKGRMYRQEFVTVERFNERQIKIYSTKFVNSIVKK
jgi:hypothetical protein